MEQDEIVILLAFANDKQEYLSFLQEEMYDIYDALWPLRRSGSVKVEIGRKTSREKLFDYFVDRAFRDKIQIFHFAGHAGSLAIDLEDGKAFAKGLADYLENKDLVVLNGCKTKGQLQYFKNKGVKAMIVTSENINDGVARAFAGAFYKSLSAFNTLPQAFQDAYSFIKQSHQHIVSDLAWNDGQNTFRDLIFEGDKPPRSDWELHIFDQSMKNWDISQSRPNAQNFKAVVQSLQNKEKITHRFLRIGDFGAVRSKLRSMFKNTTNEISSGAFWVQGIDGFQHHWIAGNVLDDLLSFSTNRYAPPINIDLLPEYDLGNLLPSDASSEDKIADEVIKHFLRVISQWGDSDSELITDDSDVQVEIDILTDDEFWPMLQYEPIVMRVYDKIGLSNFSTIFKKVVEKFWGNLRQKLIENAKTNPAFSNPMVFILIDLSQSGSAEQCLERNAMVLEKDVQGIQQGNKMLFLDNFPHIDEQFIRKWEKTEASDPTLTENIIGKKLQQRYQQYANYNYYLGTNGKASTEIFFKKICADFRLKIELEDQNPNRIMKIRPRRSPIDRWRVANIHDVRNF